MSKPTFADLERFLHQFGFQTQAVPDSHVLLEHPEAGAHVLLRPYRAEEPVEPAVLAYVRRTLDEWGILDRERFDDELRTRLLAG